MDPVTYRPYQPQDAHDVKAIINEAFYIHRYVKASRLLDSALEVYLRERLLASTYTQVAIRNGRVIGILMGQIDGQPRLEGAVGNRLRLWAHMLKLGALGLSERKSLLQYFSFNGVYRTLRENTTAPLTDELTLFAVSPVARGLGVGKALYRGFTDHLREHGRTDFYLYTDSLCSYGFYEKHGMTRTAEQDMTVHLDGKPEHLGVYLYAGNTR